MRILTFDIEDWFHLLDFKETKEVSSWNNYPTRIYQNMDIIHEILSVRKIKATFFILAWIAEKYPDVVKKISDLGYDIGTHTYSHQLVYEQSKKEFFNDVEKSIKIIEDITGKKVKSFRAPGFSITEKNLWAFEIIKELGIEYDSSIFSAPRAHGGLKDFSINKPCILKFNGETLKEFPINTLKILNKSIVFSGGGYFRFFPYFLINYWTRRNNYIMTYFHPRDFDTDQPVLSSLPYSRKFKSYIGIRKCRSKLERLLDTFSFYDIKKANQEIDWDLAPHFNIK